MRRSRVNEASTGRHRGTRDRGFSAIQVVGALAGVSALAVAGVGAISLSSSDEPEAPADTVAQTAQDAQVQVQADPAAPEVQIEETPVAPVAPVVEVEQPTAKQPVPAAVCSTKKSDVSLQADAVVHALGVSGGTIRTSAAEAKVLARPAKGNACTKKVTLSMGEDYAFEGRLPYGKWILDLDLSGATTSVPLTVDSATVTAPKQLIGGDCGGSTKVTVKTRTEDSLLGLNGPLPGTTVTAKRVPDAECAVPAESTFTTGADGAFTGTIGYGDWMFAMTTATGTVSDFVVVNQSTDTVVLTQTVELVEPDLLSDLL